MRYDRSEKPKKFAAILCVNDEDMFAKCFKTLEELEIPYGYGVDIVTIAGAESIFEAYQAGMEQAGNAYKIYLHQDVELLNPRILYELLRIFERPKIGAVGMIGCQKLTRDAVWWYGEGLAGRFLQKKVGGEVDDIDLSPLMKKKLVEVAAADGFFLATQYDLPWRGDIFHGWHFYDISLCMEMRRAGYQVVVPKQSKAWTLHDGSRGGGEMGASYEEARKIFLREYGEFLR